MDRQAGLARHDLVLVTGPSGAGRTTAIHVLEDLGFEAIDNLPLSLMPRLFSGEKIGQPVVVGVDARTRDFSAQRLFQTIEHMRNDAGADVALVYIDCATETLLKRYNETRRRHPLALADTPLAGIEKELELLISVRDRADVLIDTTDISPHDLRAELTQIFSRETSVQMAVSIHSFSYKRGLPRGLDMVIDCRFLRNPHWQAELRPLTGLDPKVAEYVSADPNYAPFFERLAEFTTSLLPAYKAEGKSYFSIGLGCTGGQHRSVCVAEALANRLARDDWQVSIRHRELERLAGADRSPEELKRV
jgi:RNase adapter protein RapZ